YKRNYIRLKFSREKVRSILNLSLPLIPHILGGIVMGMSDRLFIEHMISLESVGFYAIGYSFGKIIALFTDSFIKAWGPWFYKSIIDASDCKKREIVKYTYLYIVAVFILAGMTSWMAKLILPFMVTESFFDSGQFIFWIALGYAVQGIYKIFFPYLVHISRTWFLAVSTVFAAIINIVLNYFLIIEFGAIGATYATVISFLVSATMVFWYQNKNYPMPWFMGIDSNKGL
ncbi:MAG: oligosaccharide flippase family protein, partial [Methylomarinum sp.]|nr:oligosaccharide flippase family protein [Methylomarinum sp.]